MNTTCFAGWEQEQVRQGLIATGTMGFPPKHPLVKRAIDWIKQNPVSVRKTNQRAWLTVGPMLLTKMYNSSDAFKKEMTIFPSYYFLPIHATGLEYKGHGKIYAYQEWGSTKQNYDTMNSMSLPIQFTPPSPEDSVSILVSSYNTKAIYIKECLDSIKQQEGRFNMELVWINDGSDELNTRVLKGLLVQFEKTTRFCKVVYSENDGNKGLGYSLNKGCQMCSNEIIMRMDSDDIMLPTRVKSQLEFMVNNKDCVLSGAQIEMFRMVNGNRQSAGRTSHPHLTLADFKARPHNHWLMNHPTFCFRKKEIMAIGSYNNQLHSMCEDFELIIRVLKHYGKIMNMPEVLLNYRLHEGQLTYNGGKEGSAHWTNVRNEIIKNVINT
jgi:amylovoran biosynthesis glycosyltransferase AmsE